MRRLPGNTVSGLAIALAVLSAPVLAQDTPETMLPYVEEAFARVGCMIRAEDGEAVIGQEIADQLGLSYIAVMDRLGPHYDVIDDAFELLIDADRLVVDEAAMTVTLVGCG